MRSFVPAAGLLALALSACASPPEDIKPAAVDPAQYSYLTCMQLVDYASSINATLKLANDQEDDARTEDVIGYALLQQPLGTEKHEKIPAEIAYLKGQLVALASLEQSKNCGQQQASLTLVPGGAALGQ